MTEEDKQLNLEDRVVLLENHMAMVMQLLKVQQAVLKELTSPKESSLIKLDNSLVLPN